MNRDTATVRFTVLPAADKLHGCPICGAKLRAGEEALAVLSPGTAHVQHADACTPKGDGAALAARLMEEVRNA